ncbi:MAG: SGNH/GDSL hydrolase family protein [Dehalococcoidia bacterium]|nr:SGNH/GDSL hydrolase family protein [Dehalococcoidia bacterium]
MNTERLKTALAILGLTVLVVVAVDLLGRAVWAIDQRFFGPPVLDSVSGALDERQFAAAYDGAGYDVATLFREFHATERIVYEPYTIWDRRYHPGELININHGGFRRTTNNSDAEDALSVWVFGGSTAWGEGAPDDETIPSHLAALMNAWGVDTTVRNLGERGYVSTQEVVFLYRELQAGRRPDVVVFYDGINDAAAASNWPEVPGSHVSLHRIRDRFQFGEVPSERRRDFVRSLGIYKASRIVLDRLEARERSARLRQDDAGIDITPKFLDANFRFLGGQAVDVWLANRELVMALGDEFSFTALFVLQPSLWTDGKPLHVSEKRIFAEHLEIRAMTHIMATRAEMSLILGERRRDGTLPSNVDDLADVFATLDEPVYIDYVHTSGPGYRIVAEALFERLREHLCLEEPPNVSERVADAIGAGC